jgi:hypothetical protein
VFSVTRASSSIDRAVITRFRETRSKRAATKYA